MSDISIPTPTALVTLCMEYPSSFRILFSISHRASLIVLSSVRLFFESLLIYSLLLKEFCQNYNSCLSGIFVFLLVIWIYQAIVSKGFDETSAVILLKISYMQRVAFLLLLPKFSMSLAFDKEAGTVDYVLSHCQSH